MRLLPLTVAAVCIALPLAAQEVPTQTLRIALAEDTDILDPSLARTYTGRIVFAGLCDKLLDINDKLEIVPQLATSYEWADAKTLIFRLRPGVTFHDGTPMDAAAVKYSLERHLAMAGSTRRAEISAMERAEVVDPLTVRVVLKTPSAPFVSQLTDRAGMIVSPKASEAAGKEFGSNPVCAGPFKFTERVAQDRFVLDRFAAYWDAANIHFARVIYRPIVDNSVRLSGSRRRMWRRRGRTSGWRRSCIRPWAIRASTSISATARGPIRRSGRASWCARRSRPRSTGRC
jgi:peptide/nickel transport system substrate-binding protein